jgi:hypothetical protein
MEDLILGRYIIFEHNNLFGLKVDGTIKIQPKYKEIIWFEANLFFTRDIEDNWEIIDDENQNIHNEKFDFLLMFKENKATFQKSNEFIFLNGYGIYQRVKFYNPNARFDASGTVIIETEKGEQGLLKINGEWFVSPYSLV